MSMPSRLYVKFRERKIVEAVGACPNEDCGLQFVEGGTDPLRALQVGQELLWECPECGERAVVTLSRIITAQ